MTPADLAQHYPALSRVYATLHRPPPLEGSRLEELHEGIFADHVRDMDRAIDRLLARFTPNDLDEQIRGLFSGRWNAWDAARTELFALATFDEDDVLDTIAWPRVGGSAPFDGLIVDVRGTRALVAVDVKTGQGVGVSLLDERLSPVAQQWAQDRGLGDVEIEIDHRGGALTQESLQNDVGRLIGEFRAALTRFHAVPAGPVTLVLNANTTIDVEVHAGLGVRVHGGVGNPAEKTASTLRIMTRHEKGKSAHAAQYTRPYLLVYVAPPGAGGADLRAENVIDAATQLAATASAWWLGTLFLDWTTGELQRFAFFRQGGNWPAGTSDATLRRTLRCP